MSWTFSTNNKIYGQGVSGDTTLDKMLYDFITFMVSVGWTITYSSDGSTMQSSNIFTKSTSGATGLGNMGSWFILREPTGGNSSKRREFQFQTQTSGTWSRDSIIVIYSAGGFTAADSYGTGNDTTAGSAANYNHPPIAYDAVRTDSFAWNGTTGYSLGDGGTSYNLIGSQQIHDYHFAAMTSAPWSWYLAVTRRVPGQFYPTLTGFLGYDGLTEYDIQDLDAGVFINGFTDNTSILQDTVTLRYPQYVSDVYRSWYKYKTFTSRSDASTSRGTNDISTYNYACTAVRSALGGLAANTIVKTMYSNNFATLPFYYICYGGTKGHIYKGKSSIFKLLRGVKTNCCDTYNISTDRDYISFSNSSSGIMLPWGGSLPNKL